MRITYWWHAKVLGHSVRHSRVPVSLWGSPSTGWLGTCECGKVWAR